MLHTPNPMRHHWSTNNVPMWQCVPMTSKWTQNVKNKSGCIRPSQSRTQIFLKISLCMNNHNIVIKSQKFTCFMTKSHWNFFSEDIDFFFFLLFHHQISGFWIWAWDIQWKAFHRIGPLCGFDLVVAMSVYVYCQQSKPTTGISHDR